MENYIAKKHWFFWVVPSVISILFIWTIIVPIIVMGWAVLRYKLDVIEYKDGCLYSRLGVLNIDKKAIPIDKISMVSEKTNIIAQLLGFGSLEVQSSAFNSTIIYTCIEKPTDFITFLNNKMQK